MAMDIPNIRKRQSKEHIEQVKFVLWVRVFHPELICAAVPNGADVSAAQRIRLVKEGMLAGFPDLILMGASKSVLLLEFKRPTVKGSAKGVVSQEQLELHRRLSDAGFDVQVVSSLDEAKKAVLAWIGGIDGR